MNVELVTVASKIPQQTYYYFAEFKESLRRFGITPTILGMGMPFRGLMEKALHFRTWLREGRNTTERIIVCDAYDIVFFGHPHGIADKCEELWGDAIVFNGEKACWPRADLSPHFPDTGPFRYLNSGFMCGPAKQILAVLEAMDLDAIGLDHVRADGTKSEPNDQGEFQRMFVAQPVPMVVDGSCQVSQTFSACETSEFEFKDGRVFNKVTGTRPAVGHLNGSAKNFFMGEIRKVMNL